MPSTNCSQPLRFNTADGTTDQSAGPFNKKRLINKNTWLDKTLSGLMWLVSIAIAVIVLCVFAVHLTDLYWISFVSGAWVTQVNEALFGNPYPALFDGDRVGGTRFMAIPIAMHAGLAWLLQLIGISHPESLIVAGRLLSAAFTAALLLSIYLVGQRFGTPKAFACLTAAVFLLSSPGQLILLSIRYDAPSAALQVFALLWATSKSPRWPLIGALLGIALFCKANAVWAGLALTCWLAWTDRKSLGWFLLGGIASVGAISLAVHLWTDGRFWENMLGLTFAESDETSRGWFGSLFAIADYSIRFAKFAILLVPLALIGWVCLAMNWREHLPYLFAAFWATAVAVYSFTDRGVSYNHLVDLLVLVSIGLCAAGAWAARHKKWLWVSASSWLILVGFGGIAKGHLTEELIHPGNSTYDKTAEIQSTLLAIPADDGRPIFANNSLIPILHGERPHVMDFFMLQRIAKTDPEVMTSVIDRLNRGGYRVVVLPNGWLESPLVHPGLVQAIETHYRLSEQGQMMIYLPEKDTPAN